MPGIQYDKVYIKQRDKSVGRGRKLAMSWAGRGAGGRGATPRPAAPDTSGSTSSAGQYFTPRRPRYSRNWYVAYRRLLLHPMTSAALEITWVGTVVCVRVSRYTFAQYIDTSTMLDTYQKARK